MSTRFRGLVAAPFTPFHADRSLNLDVIPAYARFLRDNGVGAAFVCGTTGEGLSLTLEERLRIAERWVACADDRLRVIVHVGHTCLTDARTLTAHAAKIGAAAVSALTPCFFKPRNNAEVVNWCEAVASAAPTLPF
jgi:N-acetylneuraminate lyase